MTAADDKLWASLRARLALLGIASWRSDDAHPMFFAGGGPGFGLVLLPGIDYVELLVLRLEALRAPMRDAG